MNTKYFWGALICLTFPAIVLKWSNDRWSSFEQEKPGLQSRQKKSGNLPHPHWLQTFKLNKALENNDLASLEEENLESFERHIHSMAPWQLRSKLNDLNLDRGGAEVEKGISLIRRWAEIEPAAVALWIEGLSDQWPIKQLAAEQLAVTLAEEDLATAIAWVQTLTNAPYRKSAIIMVGYEAARIEPLKGLTLAVQLEPGSDRDQLISHLVTQWSANDFYPALAWVTKVEDVVLRELLMEATLVAGADAQGQEAAEMASLKMLPGANQNRAALAIVQRWRQKFPEAATAWVQKFPESPLRLAAEKELSSPAKLHQSPEGGLVEN